MKRLLGIFVLSKNEQRVVLIVMLVLLAVAFTRYQRRVYHSPVQLTSAMKPQPTPSPVEIEEDQ